MCMHACVCVCECVCVCVCGGGGGGDEDWDIIQCPRLLSYEVRGRGGAWGVNCETEAGVCTLVILRVK